MSLTIIQQQDSKKGNHIHVKNKENMINCN